MRAVPARAASSNAEPSEVFPALWICSCIGLAALTTTSAPIDELVGEFLRSITLFPRGPYIDGAIWTLVVEAVFYVLIWAVLWTKCFQKLDLVATVLGFASAIFLTVYGAAEFFQHLPFAANAASILGRFIFKISLLRYGVFFALGIFIWLSFEYGLTRRRKILMPIMVLFGMMEIAILAHSSTQQPTALSIALPILVWIAGVAALIASIHFQADISEKLAHHSDFVQKVGLMTFPLYLNHYTFGRVMVYSLVSSNLGRPLSFAIAFTVICGSSWLIMIFPERALQSGLRKLLDLNSLRAPPRQLEKPGFPAGFKQGAEPASAP